MADATDASKSGGAAAARRVGCLHRIRGVKWRFSFLAKYALLLMSVCVCAVVLGVSITGLRDMRRRLHAATSLRLLSHTALAVAQEPWQLNHGHACTQACARVDALLGQLERWQSVTGLSLPTLRATLATARQGAVAGSANFAVALRAYERAADMLLTSLRRVFATQSDGAIIAQVALDCVMRQTVPVYMHVSVLSEYLLDSWDMTVYMRYVATAVTHAVMVNCSDYLPSFSNVALQTAMTKLPYLRDAPPLSFAQVSELPNDEGMFTSVMTQLTEQVTQVSDDVVAHWQARERFYITLTAVAAVACLLLVAIAVTAPIFLNLLDPDMSDSVFAAYARVESKTKLLSQYARSVATLTENDKLERLVGDTFLRKIDVFVRHARPCIAPTCFGDVEVTAMLNGQRKGSGGGGGAGGEGARGDAGSGVAAGGATVGTATADTAHAEGGALAVTNSILAADENGVQELRTVLGLRPAYCTLLCIATMTQTQYAQRYASASAANGTGHGNHNIGDSGGDGADGGAAAQWGGMDDTAQAVCQLVASVERVAAAHRGVVHAVRGDFIVVTWNVVSTCVDNERNALHTALDLMLLFTSQRHHGNTAVTALSMSIASGVVLAGTIDDGVQRMPMLYGAAVTRCEQMNLLNAYLDTTLLLDQAVARKLTSDSIRGYDFCIVPVALFGKRTELKGQQRTAHAVYPVRMSDTLRTWVSAYKDLVALLREGKTNDAMRALQRLQRTYSSSGEHGAAATSAGDAAAAAVAALASLSTTSSRKAMQERAMVGKLVDFWLLLLNMHMERGERVL